MLGVFNGRNDMHRPCDGAAFWSGGSLGPPSVPVIPPGEYQTAQAITGAVLLAAVLARSATTEQNFSQFLTQGVEVANRTNRWDDPKGKSKS